jgi:hypothetical protein
MLKKGNAMTTFKKTFFSTVSAVTLLAVNPALAQTTEPVATADVAGGQVVVDQQDATVDVIVPDPDVNVSQGAPVVTVEQPQPEITVVVPEPNVRVQQQAPIITVEQGQPQITVLIPEPVVTVVVPKPEVDVNTGEPIVNLEQPAPVVRFVRPEPKITIRESEPRITVEQSEANVNVDAADKAAISVQQNEAEVNVEQADGANVVVKEATGQPEVRVVDGGDAVIDIEQAQALVVTEEFNADEAGMMGEADLTNYQAKVRDLPLFNMNTDELVGRSVATESGVDVGEIDFIGVRGNTLVAIIGVGGFLGMGENEVAVPLDKLYVRGDEVIVPGVTEDRLKSMPEFNESEVRLLEPGVRLAEEIGLD